MIEYENLVGRDYVAGKVDCYGIVRDFYMQNFEIELPNYARPKDFWMQDIDLYMERYHQNGFRVIDVHPSEYQTGDVILMAIMSKIANHAGILVENGMMLHHFTNRKSTVEMYKGIWRNNSLAILRHKDVELPETTEKADLIDFLPPNIQRKIHDELKSRENPTE